MLTIHPGTNKGEELWCDISFREPSIQRLSLGNVRDKGLWCELAQNQQRILGLCSSVDSLMVLVRVGGFCTDGDTTISFEHSPVKNIVSIKTVFANKKHVENTFSFPTHLNVSELFCLMSSLDSIKHTMLHQVILKTFDSFQENIEVQPNMW